MLFDTEIALTQRMHWHYYIFDNNRTFVTKTAKILPTLFILVRVAPVIFGSVRLMKLRSILRNSTLEVNVGYCLHPNCACAFSPAPENDIMYTDFTCKCACPAGTRTCTVGLWGTTYFLLWSSAGKGAGPLWRNFESPSRSWRLGVEDHLFT